MIQEELHSIYKSGDRVTIKELNSTLQSLYNKYQIKKKAKSTDILLFGFRTKRATMAKDGKRQEGVMII